MRLGQSLRQRQVCALKVIFTSLVSFSPYTQPGSATQTKGAESQHGELNYPTVIDDHDVCGVCVCECRKK